MGLHGWLKGDDMVLFDFFLIVGAAIIFGSMGITFVAAILGEVAELIADSIRYSAYRKAQAEGLSHDESVERMNKACPSVLAEDVRAALMVIGYAVLIAVVIGFLTGV